MKYCMILLLLSCSLISSIYADTKCNTEDIKYKNSISYWQRMKEKCPRDFKILNNLALAYEESGKYHQAIKYYQQAVQVDFSNPIAYAGLGDSHNALRQKQKAIINYCAFFKYKNHKYFRKMYSNQDRIRALAHYRSKVYQLLNQGIKEPSSCQLPRTRGLMLKQNLIKKNKSKQDSSPSHQPLTYDLEILFDVNTASIRNIVKPMLQDAADFLKQQYSSHPHRIFTLVGHTDRRGSPDKNMNLSIDRARSVKRSLENLGVQRGWLKVRGMGESQLKSHGNSVSDHASNRRVELSIR